MLQIIKLNVKFTHALIQGA